MLWQLLCLVPFAAAIPNPLAPRAGLQGQFCELGAADPGGNAGKTPACKDCKTVNGIEAPKATPNVKPTDEVNGDASLNSIFGKRTTEAAPLLTVNNIEKVPGQPDQVSLFDFLLTKAKDNTDNDIDITPTDEQIKTWVIDGTPVGATGMYYEFGKTPRVWKMRGLSGCTAIIIMSSKGFWAGHLWESTKPDRINGPSSFLKRISAEDVVERSLDEFKKIAVDIMTQATPANQIANRKHWTSLQDLKTRKGDPFGNGDDNNVFILTRAKSATDKSQRYTNQINALGRELKEAVGASRGKYAALTYPGAGDTGKLKYPGTNGKIVIQYTPFEGTNGDDGCKTMAAAHVWVNPETQKDPVIRKTWEAAANQKRDTSCAKPTQKPTQKPPSCTMQNEDPDQGILTEYCVCDHSRTLPFLTISPTVVRSKSCDYTTLPPRNTKRDNVAIPVPTITSAPTVMTTPVITQSPSLEDRDLTIHTGFGPGTTDRKHCKVCSRVVNNEDSCSTIKNCIVQTGAVTLEAGSSSVHVGTVTGTALYTGVSKALEKICPTPTSNSWAACKTGSATIGGVPYVDAGFLSKDGEIVVSVESSKYNNTKVRSALIKTAAAAAQNAAKGKNCYTAHYDVEVLKVRRWWDPLALFARDHPYPQPESATWCNSVGFAGVHYYNPWWKLQSQPGATDWMDVHYEFHKSGGGDFLCSILQDAVEAFAFVQPEFAVGDIELGEAIDILCECESGGTCLKRRELDNSTLIAA
ncbi:hypothetical protein F5B19DRAFT_495043 [Rostrohypoxylon terebratum]|nr:hypothetical protein F5B19DRAFT_495043 [Rostrohypoxylon terebratum]